MDLNELKKLAQLLKAAILTGDLATAYRLMIGRDAREAQRLLLDVGFACLRPDASRFWNHSQTMLATACGERRLP